MKRLVPLIVLFAGGVVESPTATSQPTGPSDVAAFQIRWRGLTSARRLNPLFARPGEAVRIAAVGAGPFTLSVDAGLVREDAPGSWMWTAPARNGPLGLVIRDAVGDSIRLQAVVAVPMTEMRDGHLRGYRVGTYLVGDGSLRRPAPPSRFLEVTPLVRMLQISPHLRLEQFLCKQESGWPKFVVIDERLVMALEDLSDGLAARGYASTLTLMSAYRTPFYNTGLGNVRSSRHQYGQAADVYVDLRPVDGMMDDLNRDGRIDRRDADRFAELADAILGGGQDFIGGIGRYGRNASHGPFVHIDVRGFRARW